MYVHSLILKSIEHMIASLAAYIYRIIHSQVNACIHLRLLSWALHQSSCEIECVTLIIPSSVSIQSQFWVALHHIVRTWELAAQMLFPPAGVYYRHLIEAHREVHSKNFILVSYILQMTIYIIYTCLKIAFLKFFWFSCQLLLMFRRIFERICENF